MKKSTFSKQLTGIILAVVVSINSGVFGFVRPVEAATVTSLSDVMNNQETSGNANHLITFTTPNGASDGETITVTFPTDFDTSTITEDDIDISDDGVDLTTAVSCAGTEQASVAIAADTATFTICAGDGGSIGVASIVAIEIGTNATSSGTGVNQIVNPIDAGTYLVGIAGSFGDFGALALVIVDPGSVAVSAAINGGGGSGCCDGGGGGGDDTTPPNIFNLQCEAGLTQLTISWDTDEVATSAVDYGLTSAYTLPSVSDDSLVFVHELTLSSLDEGATYHYRVRSSDDAGNEQISSDQTCTTLGTSAPTTLIISNVEVIDITETSGVVTWDTNEAALCTVDYGLTESYGESVTESGFSTSHAEELTGLTEGTQYFFQITCHDAEDNGAEDGPETFVTLEDTAPTNASDLSCDPGDAVMNFSWNVPSDDDLAGVILNCSTTDFPSNSDEGTTVFVGGASSEAATVSGVNDVTYFCTLFVVDAATHISSGAVESCTPSAAIIPPDEECTDPDGCEPPTDEGCTDPDGCEPPTDEECTDPAGCPPPEEEDCTDPDGCEPPIDEGCTDPDGCEPPPEEGCTDPDGCPPPIDEGCTDPAGCEPPTDGGDETPLIDQVDFTAAEETITLPVVSEEVDVIPDRPFGILIPAEEINGGTVDQVYFTFGGSTYILSPVVVGGVTTGYHGSVMAPSEIGSYLGQISVTFTDGSRESIAYTVNAVPLGYVYEVLDGAVSRVSGAIVTLMVSQGGSWEFADVYQFGAQENPTASAADGTFAWYVANGTYRVEVGKSGYEDAVSSTFVVTNNIATVLVEIVKKPIPLEEILASDTTPLEKAELLVTESVKTLEGWLKSLINIPEVSVAFDIAVPFVILLGLLNLGLLWSFFNLLPFLQYLNTSWLLFLFPGKRKAWGVVYNAANKLPIDLAIVRLYKLPEGRLVATKVTDKEGRFFFLTQPGSYRLTAVKPGFVFPSVMLRDQKRDGGYLDIYHGEEIQVTDKNVSIAANIPLDPSDKTAYHSARRHVFMRFARRLQQTLSFLGIFIALFILVIQPSSLTLFGFLFQILLYALSLRLVGARKPKSWGIVYEKSKHHPLANTVVRIFEPTYNKLLETVLTDKKGRYSFLVGPSSYFTTYEKPGYQKQEVRPIDLTAREGPGEVAVDVELKKDDAPPTKPV